MKYRFENFELDLDRMELRRAGTPIGVEPQVLRLIAHLVTERGRAIPKTELLDEIWGDRFVSESALTTRVKQARRALEDDGTRQRLIRTVHGHGYEFIGGVSEITTPDGHTRSRLPARVQPLIGRGSVLTKLEADLRGNRLLTLVGPGGVGKTTVGFELARLAENDYADGVWPVELVGVVDDDGAIGAIATSLDVSVNQQVSIEKAILDLLRPLNALLLLDNCEHLVDILAPLISRILTTAPDVSVLTTSREALAIPGEHVWPIEPLAVTVAPDRPSPSGMAPAVALFVERVRSAEPGIEFTADDFETIGAICARLDGIPLAIELAAARARSTDLPVILKRLEHRFTLLTATRRGVDPRHRTLSDAIGWSYNLLEPAERRVFAAVAILAGPFELPAAEDLCAVLGLPDLDVGGMLAKLAEQSMLSVRRGVGRPIRYELLETLRAYGRNRLDDEERFELSAAHTRHFTETAEQLAVAMTGPDEATAAERFTSGFADLRVAYRFAARVGDYDSAFRLVGAVGEAAMRTMRYEVFSWAESLTADAERAGVEVPALLPAIVGYWYWVRGEFEAALRQADRAQVICERGSTAEDEAGMAAETIARIRANVYFAIDRIPEGLAAVEEQLAAAQGSGSRSRIVHACYMGSVAYTSAGDEAVGRELASAARQAAESTWSPTDAASAMVAEAYLSTEDVDRALDAFDAAARLARSAGNRWMQTFALTEAGGLLIATQRTEQGCLALAEAVDVWYRAGEWSEQWHTLARCTAALHAIGRFELAAKVLGVVEDHSIPGGPPMMRPVRDRIIAARADLASRSGADGFAEAKQAGAAAPLADLVHEVSSVLSGRDTTS